MSLKFSFLALIAPSSVCAFNITLDYSHDDFFTNPSNPYGAVAQAALQAAADELSGLIENSLTPITTNQVTASAGGTSAAFLVNYNYTDPSDGVTRLQTNPVGIGTDEIRIYVGAHSLEVFTFAEASTGSPSLSIGYDPSKTTTQVEAAFGAAANNLNPLFGRGSAPLQRISGSVGLNNGDSANYGPLPFGPVMGSMWFNDSPGDISSGRESWATNNDYWHFDHTTPVGTGKLDLYSIALHEIIHVLGYGTGENWNDYVSGLDWTGPEASALLGGGENALDEDGYHITSGLLSPGYEDGIPRQTVMNRSPLVGQRDQLTLLDLAFLRDAGYEIAAVPEPSTSTLVALVVLFSSTYRRR